MSKYLDNSLYSLLDAFVTSVGESLSDLSSSLLTKVDKIAGKQLSTEDYSTSEKGKLSALPTNSDLNTALSGKAALVHSHDVATSSTAGFMSTADKAKLDSINAPASTVYNYPSRTLGTAFQVSASLPAQVTYSLRVSNTAALLAGSSARITLRYADDSAMTANVKNVAVAEVGSPSGVVLTVYSGVLLQGRIPAGKYVQLYSESLSGSPTFGSVTAQEIILG